VKRIPNAPSVTAINEVIKAVISKNDMIYSIPIRITELVTRSI
jgi:hypothetical protein